ncbi:hypothetical protein [Neorhodopirellula pilleata]|uniref:Uncharacterized protein n=1 Tax=Neorhodopirellula pilleata TaxID=2714738 RepID=A0A5C6AN00_9BACT|nr:hypothetical protein [Neorhodopirellula pilleata]TWU01423.1 hypothetical protein Pla100_11500 [Neorhodopirellula pilleata]
MSGANRSLWGVMLVGFAFAMPAWAQQSASTQQTASAQQTGVATFLNPNPTMTVRLPTKPKNALGWTMKVQASPHLSADTMRIEIDFASTGGPTTADQAFLVRLTPKPQGHSPPQAAVIVSLPIDIPQGTQRMRLSRHAPKSSYGNLYEIQVFQDGRRLPDCEATIGEAISYLESAVYLNTMEQSRIRLLWVNSDADQSSRSDSIKHLMVLDQPETLFATESPQQWLDRIDNVESLTGTRQVSAVEPNDLPESWLAYLAYDTVVIHRQEYDRLIQSNSPSADALRSWNQCGGTLIIRGGSVADFAKRVASSQASEIGSIPSPEAIESAWIALDGKAGNFRQYHEPNDRQFESLIQYANLSDEQVGQWKEWFPEGARMITDSLQRYTPTQVLAPDGVRSETNLAGTIIHLGQQDADAAIEMLQWSAAEYLAGWKRHRLTRSGVEPILGSSRFFQWVIPGVAQPPVYTFMGLLGVFVILVGPVAYRKTAKAGRSYLMFAIAPVLAIATTLAMLVYGVIADGFGTQTRIRQVTWVDGETGNAITRTRSTYFAGIRPSAGLMFPGDADVTFYPDNQQRSWEERLEDRFQPQGEVVVTDDDIRLNQDFLPSRQQRQFVTHHPRPKIGRVVVEADESDQANDSGNTDADQLKSIRLRNEFATSITEVLVCDDRGDYYFVDEIAPGQTTTASELTDKEASERLGEMYKRQWLVSSIVDRRQNQTNSARNYSGESFDLLSDQVNQLDTIAKPTDGIFEFELQMRMQLGSKLPRKSFFCLTELTDDAIAVDGAVATESIHYVMGNLP